MSSHGGRGTNKHRWVVQMNEHGGRGVRWTSYTGLDWDLDWDLEGTVDRSLFIDRP